MRLALQQGVVPHRYAFGTAAALATLEPSFLNTEISARELLTPIWGKELAETPVADKALQLIDKAKCRLRKWRDSGFPDLEGSGNPGRERLS
jgi:hypothetical protein